MRYVRIVVRGMLCLFNVENLNYALSPVVVHDIKFHIPSLRSVKPAIDSPCTRERLNPPAFPSKLHVEIKIDVHCTAASCKRL